MELCYNTKSHNCWRVAETLIKRVYIIVMENKQAYNIRDISPEMYIYLAITSVTELEIA